MPDAPYSLFSFPLNAHNNPFRASVFSPRVTWLCIFQLQKRKDKAGEDFLPVILWCLLSFEGQGHDQYGSEGSGHRGEGNSAWRSKENFMDKETSELGLEGQGRVFKV